MTYSKHTTRTSGNADQYSSRSGRQVIGWVIHHAATTSLPGVLNMMSTGSKQVSANYVIDDNTIVGVVPEQYRAWTSSSSAADGERLTVEIVNDAVGSNDSNWTISGDSYRSIARLVADSSQRYGFAINRDSIIGHREVIGRYGQGYSTACPSGVDLDRIVREARAIAAGTTDQSPEEDMMKLVELNDNGQVFLVTPNGYSYVDDTTRLAGLRALGLPTVKMWFGHFIAAMYEIHEADSANDADFRAMEERIRKMLAAAGHPVKA